VGGALRPDLRHERAATRRGYSALRRHRQSPALSDYFITLNLRARGQGLEQLAVTAAIRCEWELLQQEDYWVVRSAVVMPDHVHLLITLGLHESLQTNMRLLKGRLAVTLRRHGLQWQPGFFEHRVGSSEDVLGIFYYIYLNPYRAGLIPREGRWPGYYCAPHDWNWFGDLTDRDFPQPEWLK
jgi:putative transposase